VFGLLTLYAFSDTNASCREAAAEAQEKLRETVLRTQQVRGDIFAAAQLIADGFLLLGRSWIAVRAR
jgi:hypothetical protein